MTNIQATPVKMHQQSIRDLFRQCVTGIPRSQLARLGEQTGVNTGATLALIAAILLFAESQIYLPWLYVWGVINAGFTIGVYLRNKIQRRQYHFELESDERLTRSGLYMAMLYAAISGGLWGSLAAFLPDIPPHVQILLILVIGGMAAGAAATLAAVNQVSTAFILTCCLPLVLYQLALGNDAAFVLAIVFAVFMFAMIGTSRIVYQGMISLRRSDEKYHTLLKEISDPILIHRDDRILFMNDAALESLGYQWDEVRAKPVIELCHPDDRDRAMQRQVAFARGEGPPAEEIRYLKKDGSVLIGDVHDHLTAVEHTAAQLTIFRDVTTWKEAEEAARQTEVLFRRLIEEMLDPVLIFHASQVLYVNQAGLDLFGYEWEEVKTTPIPDFVHPDDHHIMVRRQAVFDRGELPPAEEIRYLKRDGSTFLCEVYGYPTTYQGLEARTLVLRDVSARKQAEEAALGMRHELEKSVVERTRELQQSEEQVRLLLNSTAEAIYGLDLDGRCTFCNPACLAMLGYESEDDLLGNNMHDLCHYQHADGSEYSNLDSKTYQAFRQGKGAHVDDEVLWRSDGTSFPAEYWSYPTRRNGEVVGSVVTFLDITEREEAEQALRESEKWLSEILTGSMEAIISVDSNQNVVLFNKGAERIFGFNEDEVLNRPLDILFPDEFQTHHRQQIENFKNAPVSSKQMGARPSLLGQRKDGEVFPAEASISKVTVGGRQVFTAFLRDITERSKSEADRRLSEERFRTQMEGSLDAIFYLQAVRDDSREIIDFVFTDVNEHGIDFVDFRREELIGGRLCELMPDNVTSGIFDFYKETLESGVPVEEERHVMVEGVTAQWVHHQIVPITNGLAFHSRDITEKKALEEQLRQTQKIEAIGQLAGGIAHDFNNLLTVINGYSEILLARTRPEDPLHHDLSEIEKAAHRAEVLTRQLLAFSRKQVLKPKVINMLEVFTSIEGMLRRLIGEHIQLSLHCEADLKNVNADQGQMEQVIMNLVINARDAMPQGGTLTATFDNVKIGIEARKNLSGLSDGNYVMLSLADTGVGMEKEIQDHIFEPFYTTKEVGRGTGLGLATVYGIVDQSGGGIDVTSAKGKGTTFSVYLPVVTGSDKPDEEEKASNGSFEGAETILVVEDEDLIRKLLQRMLESLGYKVLVSENGRAALQLAERYESPIDLLLTDILMPQMGGYELTEQIAAIRPDMPVLYMTGYDEENVSGQGLPESTRVFIQKPFLIREIGLKIREILDHATQHSAISG